MRPKDRPAAPILDPGAAGPGTDPWLVPLDEAEAAAWKDVEPW